MLSIFEAKGRPADNPLIVHVGAIEDVEPLCYIDENAQKMMYHFWPGPLTLILKSRGVVAPAVSCGLGTVAVRMPGNGHALLLLEKCKNPVAAPSANYSGRPSPTCAAHVFSDMEGRIPLILDGGRCSVGLESTVVDMTGDIACILRPGLITPQQIHDALGAVDISNAVLREMDDGAEVPSPGLKHSHYMPKTALTLVDGSNTDVEREICRLYDVDKANGLKPVIIAPSDRIEVFGDRNMICIGSPNDIKSVAREFYSSLLASENIEADTAYMQAFPQDGVGLAVMNRALRAAGFNIRSV